MKIKKRFLVLVLMLFTTWGYLTAQVKSGITGKVIDEKQKPVEFATVTLFKAGDLILVKTTMTSEQGEYKFDLAAGKYIVSVTAVGYKKVSSKEINKTEQSEIKLPDIVLFADSKTLNEVTVIGKKPFIEKRADKTIVNV